MTLTLELSPEQEARLAVRAKAAGMSDPRQYLLALIDDGAQSSMPKTGADLMARIRALNLSGNFGDPSLDSPDLARELRRQAESRDPA